MSKNFDAVKFAEMFKDRVELKKERLRPNIYHFKNPEGNLPSTSLR